MARRLSKRTPQLDRNPRLRLPRWTRADLDAHLHVERIEEALQSLHAESSELPAHQVGYVRLLHSEQRRGLDLGKPALAHDLPDHPCQLGLGQPLPGIRQPQVFEDVAGAVVHLGFLIAHRDSPDLGVTACWRRG